MGNEENLTVDKENYKNTLRTYLSYRHQQPAQTQWMESKFATKIKETFATKREIRMLAVGSGSGETDIEFLNEIVKKGKEIHGDSYRVIYVVIEPNVSCAEYFRKTVKENEKYRNVAFQWFSGYYDDFCEEFRLSASSKFDFIHFVRCFYHIDSEKSLDAAYNLLLSENGFIAVLGENSGFWPKLLPVLADNNINHEAFSISGSAFDNYFLTGWTSCAEKKNWKYEAFVQGYDFDVTPIYDPDSKDGNMLVDFAFHKKDVRKTFGQNVIDSFLQFLDKDVYEKDMVCNGKQVRSKCFPCEFGAIMMTKLSS